jgi:hypothetical protein
LTVENQMFGLANSLLLRSTWSALAGGVCIAFLTKMADLVPSIQNNPPRCHHHCTRRSYHPHFQPDVESQLYIPLLPIPTLVLLQTAPYQIQIPDTRCNLS